MNAPASLHEFKPGETVHHRSLREGTISLVEGDAVTVRFRLYGMRKVLASFLSREAPSIPESKTPDPVDLWAKFQPPRLPRAILPGEVEEFAFIQGDMMGADPAGLAMAALTACAAAIPDRIKLQVKRHDTSWTESARLWVALIGDPSTKKSPIVSQAIRPIFRIDARLYHEWAKARAEFDKLGKDEQKAAEPPKQTRLRIEDVTIESAQEILKDSPDGVLCFQDELSGWFGAMDKYSGHRGAAKDRAFWLQSFNGGSYAVSRIGRGTGFIENLSVSLVGGIQPELIRKLAGEAVDDGLLQRLFPIVLHPAGIGKDEPAPNVGDMFEALVNRLYGLQPPTPRGGNLAGGFEIALRFDDEAQAIRRELEQRHLDLMGTEAINKKLASHIGKYDGLFARLCVIFHCIENSRADGLPQIVIGDTAARAARFLHDFLLPHALAFYSGVLGLSEGHDALTSLAGYILAHDDVEEITFRDVQRGDRTMRSLTRDEAQKLLERLEYFGWLEPAPMARNGTAPRWRVNRRVRTLFKERGEQERNRREKAREMIASLMPTSR